MKICSIEGCEHKVDACGLCTTHYGRWRKYGDPLKILRRPKYRDNELCSVDGCKRLAKKRDMCKMHYQRWWVHGDPNMQKRIKSYAGIKCRVDKCEKQARANGLCKIHYTRNKKYGDPTILLMPQDKIFGRQLCKKLNVNILLEVPEYRNWRAMLNRCRCKKHKAYHRYGGRGIVVCKRWKLFRNFYADMGPMPHSGYTIDRIDNDGIYEPANCRWITRAENSSKGTA